MGIITLFIVSFTIALSGALAPGPLLATVIAQSFRHGAKTAPLIMLGHAALEAVLMGLIVLGIAPLVSSAAVMRAIALAGALVLCYFGIRLLVSVPRLRMDTESSPATASHLVLMGITVSLSNPYWTVWWLTIGLSLVLAAKQQGWLAIIIFFLGHVSADFGWYGIVSVGISRGRKSFSDKTYRAAIAACAVALIGFALYFALRAF